VAPAVHANGRSLRVRRHSANSGIRNSAGYSFAAAPRPSSTPASVGRCRDQASSPPPASAIAIRSQLVKACTTSSGANATIAASHIRRRASAAVVHVIASMQNASRIAVMMKYVCTAGKCGSRWSPSAGTAASYRCASALATPMSAPVSTGYSTGWSRYGTAPVFSSSE
jgi:hypothetical protein